MKIAVCFKIVPTDQGVKVKSDRTLDISATDVEISSFDMNAIEAAVKAAAEIADAKIVAVTAGDAVVENTKMRKAALSRGPAEMIAVKDDALAHADAFTVAETLAAAIRKLDDCKLVICGEGSADMYNQQTGSMLGYMLGYNTVNGVCGITPVDGGVIVERVVDAGVEVMEVKYPAVLSVTSDINMPRIPSMRDILGAGKKPVTVWSAADLGMQVGSKGEVVSVLAPADTDRKKEIYDGGTADGLEKFLAAIAKAL